MRLHTRIKDICTGRRTGARRFSSSAAVALLALVLVAGCTGAAEEQPPAAGTEAAVTTAPSGPAATDEDSEQNEAAVITITDFTFDVPDTIAPGTEVTVRNEDRVGHTVTSDEEGLFDVLVGGGQEATFTVPDRPGEYAFFCKPHPNMVATLVVG